MNENETPYTDMGDSPHQDDYNEAKTNEERRAAITAEIKSHQQIFNSYTELLKKRPENAERYNSRIADAESEISRLQAELAKYPTS